MTQLYSVFFKRVEPQIKGVIETRHFRLKICNLSGRLVCLNVRCVYRAKKLFIFTISELDPRNVSIMRLSDMRKPFSVWISSSITRSLFSFLFSLSCSSVFSRSTLSFSSSILSFSASFSSSILLLSEGQIFASCSKKYIIEIYVTFISSVGSSKNLHYEHGLLNTHTCTQSKTRTLIEFCTAQYLSLQFLFPHFTNVRIEYLMPI